MNKFRKKKQDTTDDFQKEATDGDLEAGAALNKSGRDDEFQDAAGAQEEEKKDKIIWFPREKKYFWRE